MVKVSIIYHSRNGHTKKQAKAVFEGASAVLDTEVKMFSVEEVDANLDFINDSDVIIFGSPTYMGTISAKYKEFMENTSKIWFKQTWKDKLAAGFVNSGWASGDKLNSLNQLAIFAAQHGMVWVSLGLIPGDLLGKPETKDINRLGSFLGAMSCSPFDQSDEFAPPKCDLQTAKFLGERVAKLAHRWAKGNS
jgi:multimeric flavodoxin WrbA